MRRIKLQRPDLCKLAAAAAYQVDERAMAGGTRGNQRALCGMRGLIMQRPAVKIGHRATRLVHQKVGGGEVPVVAAGRGQGGIEVAARHARESQRQRKHLGLRQDFRVYAASLSS